MTVKEYIIGYTAGTSPYRYNVSLYAETKQEAVYNFLTRSDLCPDNVKTVEIVAILDI